MKYNICAIVRSAVTLVLILASFVPYATAAGPVDTPGYWIKKIKAPDEIVMSPSEIEAFNKTVASQVGQMAEPGSMDGYVAGGDLLAWLLEEPLPSPEDGIRRFDLHGDELTSQFLYEISANMNIEWVEERNPVRFGVITELTDVRAFPTDEPAFKGPSAGAFDMFQYSSVYPSEPVTLLHSSADGLWGFFQLRTVRGWIRLDKVAFGARSEAALQASQFITITGNRVDVYSDMALSVRLAAVPMGTMLSLSGHDSGRPFKTGSPVGVSFPQRTLDGTIVWVDGYLDPKADISRGFLPYTRRNVITQAFKMLGEEYSWGGRDGNRDCSEFIKQVFASMGLRLPRNSGQQIRSGSVKAALKDGYATDDVKAALRWADPGVTLVGMSGHIMLHIGERRGRQYVIHQVYGYKVGRRMKVVNRAEVTSLDIGKGTRSGPLKNRVRSVTEIIHRPTDKKISASGSQGQKG
ncbi:MAG: SH3 domain-containing protein [Deltaproteobacteria bacterium]